MCPGPPRVLQYRPTSCEDVSLISTARSRHGQFFLFLHLSCGSYFFPGDSTRMHLDRENTLADVRSRCPTRTERTGSPATGPPSGSWYQPSRTVRTTVPARAGGATPPPPPAGRCPPRQRRRAVGVPPEPDPPPPLGTNRRGALPPPEGRRTRWCDTGEGRPGDRARRVRQEHRHGDGARRGGGGTGKDTHVRQQVDRADTTEEGPPTISSYQHVLLSGGIHGKKHGSEW